MSINDEYEVIVLRRNNEGEGVSKIDNMVVFIKGALEEEKVKIKIDKLEKNYAHANIVEIISKSQSRINPVCPYYKLCGGCDLMHENYESQLNFKKEKIKSIFKKLCNENIDLDIVSSNELNYRNKVTLRVQNDKIGFYKNKTNEIIEIDECKISNNKINEIILKLKEFITKNKDNKINEIMIRTCNNKSMIVLDDINKKIEKNFIDTFKEDSIYINNKNINGDSKLIQSQNNMNFYVSSKSFFQVNKEVSEKLFDYIRKQVTGKNVLDLYSGTGTISLILSETAKKVIGIEVVSDAVNDANDNMKLNDVANTKFICGKVEDKIDKIKKEEIDTIILDPPRSGSDKKSLRTILEIEPKNIIYVSCNPVTLARDYNILKDKYNIKSITAFDMFPQTHHIESLMVLERK